MRGQAPLHEGHLAEAVRRGVITDAQREALLALARSEANPIAGHIPDLRWTVVVQGIAAALAVIVPGVVLLAQIPQLSEPVQIAASLFAALLFGALGWVARERGWGRVPASIFSAAVAPYLGGVAMFSVDLAWRGALGPQSFDSTVTGELTTAQRDTTFAVLLIVGAVAAMVSTALLTRARPNGPAWSVASVCLTPLTMGVVVAVAPRAQSSDVMLYVILAASALVGVALSSWQRARLQRGGIDGAAWFELGLFGPTGILMIARLWRHSDELAPWLIVAAVVAVAGALTRRWTYQLVGALGLVTATLAGLHEQTFAVRSGAVVAVAVALAFAAQSMRRREAERAMREPAREPLSYWE